MLRTPAIENRFDLAQCLFALAGRQSLDRADILGTGAKDAHALGAAELDARK
jgi:hypothetical protein